jgi:hypothetical protein
MTKHAMELKSRDQGGVRVAVGTVLWDQRDRLLIVPLKKSLPKKGDDR